MLTSILNQIAIAFDLPILDWIQSHLQCAFLDFIMPIITLFGEDGIFWIAWAVLLLLIPKQRKTGLAMAIALVMGLVVCNMTLKPLVQRIRPYDLQDQLGVTISLLIEAQHDFSFPSGHTIASFEACTVLMLSNKKMGIPATIIAVLVAFSRLYLYVHYLTDVLAAMVLGILFGFIACWIVNAIFAKNPANKGKFEK